MQPAAEMSLAVSLALHVLSADGLQEPATGDSTRGSAAPLGGGKSTEIWARLSEELAVDRNNHIDFQSIFVIVYRLCVAFEVRSEGEVLVGTLVLIERLIRCQGKPCFTPHTAVPILLTAFTLSCKCYFEGHADVVGALNFVGFATVEPAQLFELEKAFLDAVDWNLEVSRKEYTAYVFALRKLLSETAATLRAQYPTIVQAALELECSAEGSGAPRAGLLRKKLSPERSLSPRSGG